ncbi:MAG: cytidine deaminase [Bacteroidales bacterium]|jgi:cytidine deaminase|nr:cytidine deaminase [Bacteroidales bacterium]
MSVENKQIKINYKVYDKTDDLTKDDVLLVKEASEAARKSYSPFSGFAVGAAVRLASGKVLSASNQENSAYPSGLCAERSVLFYTMANYPDDAVVAIAIAAFKSGRATDAPAYPCGACLQVMSECQARGGRKIRVICSGARKSVVLDSVEYMLPFAFDNLLKR